MKRTDAWSLLQQGVPLSLLLDLYAADGPDSAEIYAAEAPRSWAAHLRGPGRDPRAAATAGPASRAARHAAPAA
jgi:hypothetical protein